MQEQGFLAKRFWLWTLPSNVRSYILSITILAAMLIPLSVLYAIKHPRIEHQPPVFVILILLISLISSGLTHNLSVKLIRGVSQSLNNVWLTVFATLLHPLLGLLLTMLYLAGDEVLERYVFKTVKRNLAKVVFSTLLQGAAFASASLIWHSLRPNLMSALLACLSTIVLVELGTWGVLRLVQDVNAKEYFLNGMTILLASCETLLSVVIIKVTLLDASTGILVSLLTFPITAAIYSLEFRDAALKDARTGLLQHRFWLDKTTSLLSEGPLTLLMLDIDHFKAINDTFGHPMGDKVLDALGRLLRETSRKQDVVTRWGGEEFAIALPFTTEDDAEAYAERIRVEVEHLHERSYAKGIPPITVSIGGSRNEKSSDNDDYDAVLRGFGIADAALYEAKHSGRNRVIFAD